MVALDMDGKVRKPQFELDSEQVRYEHRFAPFNSVVTPPPVHYIQFKVLFVCVGGIYLAGTSIMFVLSPLHSTFLSVSALSDSLSNAGDVRSEEVQSPARLR